MKYKVRQNRTLVTPDGRVWATSGQVVDIDIENPVMVAMVAGRMNCITPIADNGEDAVALPEMWARKVEAAGVPKLDRKAPPVVKRGRPKGSKNKPKAEAPAPKPESLGDPEE